jgi:sulfur-carrier protein
VKSARPLRVRGEGRVYITTGGTAFLSGLRYGCDVVSEPAPDITIHIFGQLREYCGGARELSVSAQTVRSLLERLEQDQPLLYRNLCDETGKVRRHLNVFVNTENVRDLDGVGTTLAAGDVVTFLPAVSGG